MTRKKSASSASTDFRIYSSSDSAEVCLKPPHPESQGFSQSFGAKKNLSHTCRRLRSLLVSARSLCTGVLVVCSVPRFCFCFVFAFLYFLVILMFKISPQA